MAGLVAQGRDDDIGPEAGAILANPPALVLHAPIPDRGREFRLRLAMIEVLGGIEDREVPADDLLGLIALDPLGPGVPTDDVPAGIEHEDGVVLHGLHDDAEPLLAHAQGLLHPFMLEAFRCQRLFRFFESPAQLPLRLP